MSGTGSQWLSTEVFTSVLGTIAAAGGGGGFLLKRLNRRKIRYDIAGQVEALASKALESADKRADELEEQMGELRTSNVLLRRTMGRVIRYFEKLEDHFVDDFGWHEEAIDAMRAGGIDMRPPPVPPKRPELPDADDL